MRYLAIGSTDTYCVVGILSVLQFGKVWSVDVLERTWKDLIAFVECLTIYICIVIFAFYLSSDLPLPEKDSKVIINQSRNTWWVSKDLPSGSILPRSWLNTKGIFTWLYLPHLVSKSPGKSWPRSNWLLCNLEKSYRDPRSMMCPWQRRGQDLALAHPRRCESEVSGCEQHSILPFCRWLTVVPVPQVTEDAGAWINDIASEPFAADTWRYCSFIQQQSKVGNGLR